MIAPAEDSGLFSAIAGLPLHPLVVHLAVVVLPASALALVGLVLVPRWRARYATLTVAAALLGTAGAFAAKESGEALADRVGLPAEHAEWGDRLFLVAVVYAVVTVVWFVLHRRQARQTVAADIGRDSRDDRDGRATIPDRRARPTGILSAVNAVAGILAVAVLALTVVVGHTGATAVWGDTPAASTSKGDDEGAAAPDAPSGTATAGSAAAGSAATGSTTAGSATSSGTRTGSPARPKRAASVAHTYTLAQVHRHGDRSSCWVAVDGSVYDLNRWVGRHLGGPEAILGICGSDATSAFHAQHGKQRRPAAELATFRIGALR
ncbi:cytochrome b5 domain-containing protein [Terracoccus luteus]|uniref:Putative membrane protein/predicted heme/steroid binding protein n=1 Tax=Terracoccus luteus TaxID=53356 RepID=A0A839PZW3_9MICO|nr:cytochrome b5-like heme/steroid binding domain-containing protein [Terracoccus luteus]MBB2987546.1 putative membrane protein/predicted heme/steroid binding protein [Terracoccus luteus]MCP2173197.1 putative membrane protein/predicted heme/steroid binding protein [Terracoccus luteus]